MKDVYEQVYYQPNTMQVQDQQHLKKSQSSNSSTVLGRFLKLGKSKSDGQGTSTSGSNGSNLKRRHTPNPSNEFEDEFRLTPSQLRGVERMVHKANMKKDVSRSHSWIFGSVKLPSDMPPGYGYEDYNGGGNRRRSSTFDVAPLPSTTPISEYCSPNMHNGDMHMARCQTAAEDYCCSCEFQDDFNFLAGSSGSSSNCKACNRMILEGSKYLKNGIIGGNRKFEQESGKKFASSVRKLTWKSLKQAVKKRPSLDSLKKPTSDWLSSSSIQSKELASFSHENFITSPSPSATNYFFPDKKNGFYASCTDLQQGEGDIGLHNITATASVRVRPKRSRQSWHFPNEFGPVPNYQEEETAMYHSEWDLRQYMPMPYEEWLTSTSSPPSAATNTNLQMQTTKNQHQHQFSDFDACFEPPTSVKVSLNSNNNNNELRIGNRLVSRGSNNNNTSPSKKINENGNGNIANSNSDSNSISNNNSADLYSNGGVKRFSILYTEATAYQLNKSKSSLNYQAEDDDNDDDDQDEDDDDDEDDHKMLGKAVDDQVRIAGQGIFMMAGNSSSITSNGAGTSCKVARSNSGSSVSARYQNQNLNRGNHPHHLLFTSSDGVWSDLQQQSSSRDRVQLLPDKGMSNNGLMEQQNVSFTSFQQQSTFSHYAGPSGSNMNMNGTLNSSRMSDGNGSRHNNANSAASKYNNLSNSSASANNSNQHKRNSSYTYDYDYENDSLEAHNGNNNNSQRLSHLNSDARNSRTAGLNQNQHHQDLSNSNSDNNVNNSVTTLNMNNSHRIINKVQFSESSSISSNSGKAAGKVYSHNGNISSESQSGNKYGALRRRKGSRSSSGGGSGKNLLRETIYEEDSEHTDVDCDTANAGDKESYAVKIVVSQNGNGIGSDYVVKPILKNRGQSHYATPNVSMNVTPFYANTNTSNEPQCQYQNQNDHQLEDTGGGIKTRKKVQFNSDEVVLYGGLSEPELDLEDEEEEDAGNHVMQENENAHESMSLSSNSSCCSNTVMKPADRKEISIGGMGMTKMTVTENTEKKGESSSYSSSQGTTNEEEVVQMSRVPLKTDSGSTTTLPEVNNLQLQEQDLGKLNTNPAITSTTAMKLIENESNYCNNERTGSRKNNTTSTMPATTATPTTISMTTTTTSNANSSTSTQSKRTSDEERRGAEIQHQHQITSSKKTPHGSSSCSSMKAERIGNNKEQQTISKVKGCQPQKICNPNSLLFEKTKDEPFAKQTSRLGILFNDTTRIRLNQARPSIQQTFKLNFDHEQKSESSVGGSSKVSLPPRKVRTSHSFRGAGASQMMQIPNRPREPPPPPPVPYRVLPPIPTSETETRTSTSSLPKSNQSSNGYGPGLGVGGHVPSTRSAPTNKSQISLPMPMLGFSTTNNNVANGKPLTSIGAAGRHVGVASSHSIKPMITNRNKSLALAEKCDAIEKVLSQKLSNSTSPSPGGAPIPNSSSKLPSSKTGKSTSSPKSPRHRINTLKSESRPLSHPHPRESPPPRPPPISPKPLIEIGNKLSKSKQGNQTQFRAPAPPPADYHNNNNNYTNTISSSKGNSRMGESNNSGESHSQNIEIVTRENSVSEIRIYSGTNYNLTEQPEDEKNESQQQQYEGSKIVPNFHSQQQQNYNTKEIHYAATDLFQKDGSFNFSNQSVTNDQQDQYCQSSGSTSCSRPQSTSVVLIIDTGSCNSDAEATAVANSITKALKPNASHSPCQTQATRPVDLLPQPHLQSHAAQLSQSLHNKLKDTLTLPMTTMTMMSQKIEGRGVGQYSEGVEEEEPVYDDVINHSASAKVELVTKKEKAENEPSPPNSPPPPPVPSGPPPPLGDNDNDIDNETYNLYNDIERDPDADADEDSGTCIGPISQASINSLCEDIIYDDTLSVISNNYEMNLLKINNSKQESEDRDGSESTRGYATKTKTSKFLPLINLPKPIKKDSQSSLVEDEPMYDDVLNLISLSDTTKTTSNISAANDSDSGTETDSPPPLPTSGPPVHLLPKISMELPLIPLPIQYTTKKTFSEKIQEFGKKKIYGNGNDTKAGHNSDLQLNGIEGKSSGHSQPKPNASINPIEDTRKSSGSVKVATTSEESPNVNDSMTISVQNRNQKLSVDNNEEDDVLDRTRTLLNELNDKLSKLSFSPDYSSYVSKVVISSSSDSSGVEEDYNSEKNYSLSNGSDAASSGDDNNYKLSKLVTETISMARGKFLDSMKLNLLTNGGETPSPVSDLEEPIYEEINENNNDAMLQLRDTSPIYSDAFDAKSIFDGASRSEILSFLESIRDRLTNPGVQAEPNSDSCHSSLTKKSRKIVEIERNDSGIGSESGSLVAIGIGNVGRNGRILESLCKDCNDAPVDPRINSSGSGLDSAAKEACSVNNSQNRLLELCRSCSRKRSERKEIILEIYETEMKYGRDLRIVADEFYNPIQTAGLLAKEQLEQIFLNVTQLIEMNAELTSMLKTAIDAAIATHDEDLSSVSIGRIFIEIGEKLMSAFESYCTRQANAGALLTQLEKEKELLRIFLRVSQMENAVLRRMNLPAFLMVPVQRVTRYPLLLSRLLKVTCPDHSSREELQLAHEKIEHHLEHMNKTTREVASVKLWRRISIINGNNSPVHRRSSNDLDGANIRIRKMAFDVLDWANFTDVTCVIENQLNIVNLNGKSLRNIYGCLLARGKDLDNLALKMDQDIFFPPAEDIVKDVKLVLVRVKNTRFCLLREPLCLSKCIVSQGENEFQDFIEINEITTKSTYYLQAMDKQGTSVWLKLLQCHAVCVGQWRRRRGALANIMMNGMIRHL